MFDTTLRDGEQAPGCSMTLDEKLRVAAALVELKVDIIEAGFPAASPGDFESVQTIARTIEGPTICGLVRCNTEDIKLVWDAVRDAQQPRIHVFVATSQIHREHKLQMAKEEIIKVAVESVTLARSLCEDGEVSPEDAGRAAPVRGEPELRRGGRSGHRWLRRAAQRGSAAAASRRGKATRGARR